MGLTTDVFDPSPEQMRYAAELEKARMHNETTLQAAKIQADAQERIATGKAKAPRAPQLSVEQKHLAEAATAGKELGAPTSFAGGAGAPPPIEVIRGTTRTYAQPTPQNAEGKGFVPEYATALQAAQAYNRAMAGQATAAGPTQADITAAAATKGTPEEQTPQAAMIQRVAGQYGGHVPEKGPELQLKAEVSGLDTLRKAQAQTIAKQQEKTKESEKGATFDTDFRARYPELAAEPEKWDQNTRADYQEAKAHYQKTGDMEGAQKLYNENREIRQYAPHFNEKRVQGLFGYMATQKDDKGNALGLSPDRQEKLVGMLKDRDQTQKKQAMRFLLPYMKNYLGSKVSMGQRQQYEGYEPQYIP